MEVGRFVYGIATAGDTVWAETDDGLVQLDGASGDVLQTIPGFRPEVIGDTLWYEDEGRIVAADADTGEERRSYAPPVLGTRAVTDGTLWVAGESGVLAKVDLARNRVVGELELPAGEVKAMTYWEGAVWVVIDGSDVILRVDPDRMRVIDQIDGGSRPHSVAVGFGSLWVIEHGRDTVQRIQPDGKVAATISDAGYNVAITVTSDAVWAATSGGLAKIDPETNEIVDEIELGYRDWYAVAESQGSLWLTSAEGGYVYQIPID